MIIIDRLLVGGIRFVLDKLVEAAEAETNDDSALREELLAAQMKLERSQPDRLDRQGPGGRAPGEQQNGADRPRKPTVPVPHV